MFSKRENTWTTTRALTECVGQVGRRAEVAPAHFAVDSRITEHLRRVNEMSERSTSLSRVRQLAIGPEHAGQRIDNFLAGRLKGVPRSRIYRILRKGEVRVNKGRIPPHYRLKAGDIVRIPPVRLPPPTSQGAPPLSLLRRLDSVVLYEDDGLIVINKPSGIAVHGGSGFTHGIVEAMRAARPRTSFLELVHRLDRDTSGCLMLAKKRSSLRFLHEQLREGAIRKQYLALVEGQWRGGEHRIEAPLHKNVLMSGERIVRVHPRGKAATTLFRPLRHFQQATLLQATPVTGRTHQIRVHAAFAGHPILGDAKYGLDETNRLMRSQGLRRLFLHAESLCFRPSPGHPSVEVEAPLPAELVSFLESLVERQKSPPR